MGDVNCASCHWSLKSDHKGTEIEKFMMHLKIISAFSPTTENWTHKWNIGSVSWIDVILVTHKAKFGRKSIVGIMSSHH